MFCSQVRRKQFSIQLPLPSLSGIYIPSGSIISVSRTIVSKDAYIPFCRNRPLFLKSSSLLENHVFLHILLIYFNVQNVLICIAYFRNTFFNSLNHYSFSDTFPGTHFQERNHSCFHEIEHTSRKTFKISGNEPNYLHPDGTYYVC